MELPPRQKEEAANIARRLQEVRERIAAAARRSGRRPEDITLVAVTKNVPPEGIMAAFLAGQRDFGENRVQEARDKLRILDPEVVSACRWHLIGHLQRNKVNMALPLFSVIHSWDRLPLVQQISQRAQERGRVVEGFVQVNIGREPSKHGIDPDELLPFLRACLRLPGLHVRGLMCIPPPADDPEQSRPYFRRMRELLEEALEAGIPGFQGRELSMGMTDDFEVAIEEGATIVRVGRALFGPRPR